MKTYSKLKTFIIITMLLIICIFIYPSKILAADTISDVMNGAEKFVNKGRNFQVNAVELKSSSDFIYNTLLGISLIIAVITGMLLGIKYMIASSEEQAKIKETMVPYVISCFVMFGAFIIWKIAVKIFSF